MSLAVELDRESSLVLVHDVVNDFLAESDEALAAMLDNVARLLEAARDAGLPIVFAAPGQGDPAIGPRATRARLVWGSKGVDVPETLGPLAGEMVIRKPRYGAFFGSALAEYMRHARRDTLVLCGLSLAGGVETTVRDAHNRDLRSILVADACLCRPIPDQGWGVVSSEEVAKVTLSLLAQRFAQVTTTDEICAALLEA
jgi:ureidoacrylate peracid hydrolase